MFKLKYIFVLLFVLIVCKGFAIDIEVCIFSDIQLKKIKITPLSGKYVIYNDSNKIADLYKNNPIEIEIKDEKIILTKRGENLGSFTTLTFSAEGFLNTFSFLPVEPVVKERVYDDGIKISINNGFFKVINKVDIEHYVAGVVESEGGIKKNLEFLKVQAIISRTYAISNIRKHLKDDGYSFCDKVHCQLYKGRCINSMIMMATSQTTGDIIIDKSNKPVSAAFHSNCGGQTANSEDVWSISTTYLKSIKDTFCLKQSQAKWTKKIAKKEWLEYLFSKFNYPVSDSIMLNKALTYTQSLRKVNFDDNPNIPLKMIRSDWKLKSTFFNIENNGDTLIFRGRGFGHGVGLCQEGAMRLVDKGWTFKNIIKYYYTDVSIINILELKTQ